MLQLPAITDGSDGTLHANFDGAPILILETSKQRAVATSLAELGIVAGLSSSGPHGELPALIAQADRALEHAVRDGAQVPVEYSTALHDGMLHLLDELPGAHARAGALLAPLRTHDARHDDAIERSLAVWLAHHGQTSPAAAELGVHRHTLRSRISTAAELLGLDLDSPDTRAEIWAALRLSAVGQA